MQSHSPQVAAVPEHAKESQLRTRPDGQLLAPAQLLALGVGPEYARVPQLLPEGA